MTIKLDFESLFKQALADWPNVLDLSVLQYAKFDFSQYAVKGLGSLAEEIENGYIGTEGEAVTRTLHYAIHDVIYSVAKTILKLDLSLIRPEVVRLTFENRLREAILVTDLNWRAEDYALAEAYFAQNVR